jgi:hypothetical protein
VNRAAVTALAAVAVGWCALVLMAPAAVSGPHDAGGARWAALVYEAAAGICHQRVQRSFAWDGVAFPVCGRCLALYLSGAAAVCAAAVAAWRSPRHLAMPSRPLWVRPAWTVEATWLAVAAAPSVVLLLVEWVVADPGTVARAGAALPLGAMVGWICGAGLARSSVA